MSKYDEFANQFYCKNGFAVSIKLAFTDNSKLTSREKSLLHKYMMSNTYRMHGYGCVLMSGLNYNYQPRLHKNCIMYGCIFGKVYVSTQTFEPCEDISGWPRCLQDEIKTFCEYLKKILSEDGQ